MKARSRCGLLLLLTVMGVAGVVASAQAQTISPSDADLMLFADDPTFGPVTCDTGTLSGRTGSNQDYVNLALDFFGNCDLDLGGLSGEFSVRRRVAPTTTSGPRGYRHWTGLPTKARSIA